MSAKKTLFIQHQPPYSNESAQEQLDALLVCATFGQSVSVLFQGDGVWQLQAQQNGEPLGKRTLAAQLQILPLYDIQRLYVDETSLKERGINTDSLLLPVQPLDETALKALLADQDMVVRF